MIEDRPFKDKVTVHFVRRDDGGLQAICDSVPGFYLSGRDPSAVYRDVIPALELSFVRTLIFALKCSRCGTGSIKWKNGRKPAFLTNRTTFSKE